MPTDQEHPMREVLPLYLFGLLSPEEARELEQHMQGCADCRAELHVLREVSAEMPHALAGPKPHPRVKEKLLASIGKRSGKPEKAAEGIFVYREFAWRPSEFTGVEYQVLYLDRTTETITTLLRLAPGSTYPAHHHSGVEQSYVVEGSCYVGEVRLSKGEFAFAVAGSDHGVLQTEEGCTLLVVSSQHDIVSA